MHAKTLCHHACRGFLSPAHGEAVAPLSPCRGCLPGLSASLSLPNKAKRAGRCYVARHCMQSISVTVQHAEQTAENTAKAWKCNRCKQVSVTSAGLPQHAALPPPQPTPAPSTRWSTETKCRHILRKLLSARLALSLQLRHGSPQLKPKEHVRRSGPRILQPTAPSGEARG